MKWVPMVLMVFAVALLFGCGGVTPKQQEEIDKLNADNAALLARLGDLHKEAKEGKLDILAAAKAISDVTEQLTKNATAVKKISEESGMGFWTTAGLVFHRTGLHLLNALPISKIPGVGSFFQFLLTMALGGSKSGIQMASMSPGAQPTPTPT